MSDYTIKPGSVFDLARQSRAPLRAVSLCGIGMEITRVGPPPTPPPTPPVHVQCRSTLAPPTKDEAAALRWLWRTKPVTAYGGQIKCPLAGGKVVEIGLDWVARGWVQQMVMPGVGVLWLPTKHALDALDEHKHKPVRAPKASKEPPKQKRKRK